MWKTALRYAGKGLVYFVKAHPELVKELFELLAQKAAEPKK